MTVVLVAFRGASRASDHLGDLETIEPAPISFDVFIRRLKKYEAWASRINSGPALMALPCRNYPSSFILHLALL